MAKDSDGRLTSQTTKGNFSMRIERVVDRFTHIPNIEHLATC